MKATKTEDDELIPMGTTSLADALRGLPVPAEEEIEAAKVENEKTVKQKAIEKLKEELKNAKDKSFADPIINYLMKRCEEDSGLSADVLQTHKTWGKCLDYVYAQARKQATGNRCAVRDDVVYEWAEDYYHKDDKAEEERKAKQKIEKNTEKKKNQAPVKNDKTSSATSKASASNAKVSKKPDAKENKKPDVKPQPKKKNTDMEGQMDFLSMMGL